MAISTTLQEYLNTQGVSYEVVPHAHTHNSSATAEAVHVPGDCLAKAVMLEDESGYLMAVIPSTHRVSLGVLHNRYRRQLGLATENELEDLFPDCELGAIPPIGNAFAVETVVEEGLLRKPDVWFESGDHEDVVHVSGTEFHTLMQGADSGQISAHR